MSRGCVFHNNGLGECVVLKKDDDTKMYLLFGFNAGQFIIAHDIDVVSGNWSQGSYYGFDLDRALESYNKIINFEIKKDDFELC